MTQRPLAATTLDGWARRVRETLDLPALVRVAGGKAFALGRSGTPAVEIDVRDRAALPLLFDAHPDALGEAYVKQRIDVSGALSDIVDVVARLAALREPRRASPDGGPHASPAAARNEHEQLRYHYDLSNDFYRLWLDESLVYAPAHFERADDTLERAQLNALDRMLDQLRLKPEQTLLDISCGWGALVIRAAQRHGVRCIGITKAENQYQLATERVRAAGLSDRIEIRLADYRTLPGRFDRIVSIGLGEPTGARELTRRFAKLHELLADDGIVVAHSMTSAQTHADAAAPPLSDPLLGRYVFPAAQPPHVSFALKAMRENGLESLDIDNLRGHHARTLQVWAQRFEQNAQRIRETIGETKYRIWRVYLAGRAYAFATGRASLYQIVGQKAGRDAAGVSWPRDALRAAHSANCALSADVALYPCGTAGPPYSDGASRARVKADAAPRRRRAAEGGSA